MAHHVDRSNQDDGRRLHVIRLTTDLHYAAWHIQSAHEKHHSEHESTAAAQSNDVSADK